MDGVHGGGKRYPSAQRRRLLKVAQGRRAEGWPWSRIGDALGVPEATLRGWNELETKANPPGHGVVTLLPVVITPAPERSEPSPLAIVSPSGWRFEGLSLDGALGLTGTSATCLGRGA